MLRQIADISVFELAGDLDRFEGRALLATIGRLIHCDWSRIVLDFGQVSHIHYRVLDEIARAVCFVPREGGIKLANLSPYHRQILRIAGADRALETYDTVADAVLSFHEFCPPAGTC